MTISVCILSKNCASTLASTLDSTQTFPEVILLDNGSNDETLDLAKNYPNVKVFHSPFIGFGPLRNKAAELSSHDWILSLDSDEVLSKELIDEIQTLVLNPSFVYKIRRHNFFRGRRIQSCGWDPEWVARLYHRKKHRFSEKQVHEKLCAKSFYSLRFPLLHTPYRSTHDFLFKMQQYSTLFAEQNAGKKRSSFWHALGHGAYAFFRSYILKRGIFQGQEGFIISIYNANTAFYKYLKLIEK